MVLRSGANLAMHAGALPLTEIDPPRVMEAESRAISWRVIGIILILAVCRILYLAFVPIELAADEAYYWDWSRQLDWGYYSKPPMIAWIAAMSTAIGGLNEFALRMPAVILGALALWGVFGTARAMYGARVGWWAFLIAATSPGNAAMSLFMTIDAPFLCAWCFAVWSVWELFRSDHPAARWLPLAILSTGLGLLSKQTMLALIPLTGAWLATRCDKNQPFPWKRYGTWAAGSLLFCLPAVLWNLMNSWLTVQHTREHFQWRSQSWTRHLTYYFEYAASQAGILSPLTYLLITMVSVVALCEWRRLQDRERFVLSLGLIPLLAITGLSFVQRIQPNWPVAFHLTGMIFLSAWVENAWSSPWLPSAWRTWFPTGLKVGVAFVVLFYAMPMVIPTTTLAGGSVDPLSRLRGWKPLARAVEQVLQSVDEGQKPLLITMSGRGIVSELAFYLPDHPRVYHWNAAGTVVSQHDVWGWPILEQDRDVVVITAAGQPLPDAFVEASASSAYLRTLRQERGGPRHDDYDVWVVRGLREWPKPGIDHASSVFRSEIEVVEQSSEETRR
jgi:4-amino-4-deoxy-L-arabinose transferase-like glycosyltransferase